MPRLRWSKSLTQLHGGNIGLRLQFVDDARNGADKLVDILGGLQGREQIHKLWKLTRFSA
jgi:hypothetical protein